MPDKYFISFDNSLRFTKKGICGIFIHKDCKVLTYESACLSDIAVNFSDVEVAMNKKIKTDAVDHLFQAVLCLQTQEECYDFFEDLCTVNELLSLSQRFEVASMLKQHKTYLEIAEKTGASTATISRVNRSLNYGNDGYDLIFERLNSR